MAFSDHHAFTPKDIAHILQQAKPFDFVLTTEKDIQRLRGTELEQSLLEQGKALVVLPIRMVFRSPEEAFNRHILTYVSENCRHNP